MNIKGLIPDHEILTTLGWILIDQITTNHLVCVLEDEKNINYVHPLEIICSEYQGKIYELRSERVDFNVTIDTLLYAKVEEEKEYKRVLPQDIIGRKVSYKRDGKNKFTGKPPPYEEISHEYMYNRIRDLVKENTTLPEWIWNLGQSKCFDSFKGLFEDITYFTYYGYYYQWKYKVEHRLLVDDIQRLCLHAGVISHTQHKDDKYIMRAVDYIEDKNSINKLDVYELSDNKTERIIYYNGPIYNIMVPSGIFMIRKNAKLVWVCS
jgi:hypothetical protein